MSISLRGHHLLCLLTYKGEGYSPAFNENFTAVAARLSDGEAFTLVEGPDDICAPLLAEDACAHCVKERIVMRDQLALRDIGAEGVTYKNGGTYTFDGATLEKLRDAFAQMRVRSACLGCEWYNFCTQVAKDGYKDALLKRLY